MTWVSHTTATMLRVRELHEAGFGFYVIARLMRDEGSPVSYETIRRWVDAEYAQRIKARSRGQSRASRRTLPLSAERKFARMCELHDAGLEPGAVAAVLKLDFGDDVQAGQVKAWLRRGSYGGRALGRPRKETSV